jgi:predicted  nucleic acid-binding Zn-ribbon protein
MDQTLINWLFAGFGASAGWLLKVVWDAIKDLKADMKQIERDLPEIYVRKDDFKSAVSDIKSDMRELRQDMKEGFGNVNTTLGMIFKKLDRKEDREHARSE